MKIVTFRRDDESWPEVGIVRGDEIIALGATVPPLQRSSRTGLSPKARSSNTSKSRLPKRSWPFRR